MDRSMAARYPLHQSSTELVNNRRQLWLTFSLLSLSFSGRMIDRVPMPHNNPLLLPATGAPQRQQQQQQQQHQNVDNVRSWLSKQAPAIQVRQKFPSASHSFAYGRGKILNGRSGAQSNFIPMNEYFKRIKVMISGCLVFIGIWWFSPNISLSAPLAGSDLNYDWKVTLVFTSEMLALARIMPWNAGHSPLLIYWLNVRRRSWWI